MHVFEKIEAQLDQEVCIFASHFLEKTCTELLTEIFQAVFGLN